MGGQAPGRVSAAGRGRRTSDSRAPVPSDPVGGPASASATHHSVVQEDTGADTEDDSLEGEGKKQQAQLRREATELLQLLNDGTEPAEAEKRIRQAVDKQLAASTLGLPGAVADAPEVRAVKGIVGGAKLGLWRELGVIDSHALLNQLVSLKVIDSSGYSTTLGDSLYAQERPQEDTIQQYLAKRFRMTLLRQLIDPLMKLNLFQSDGQYGFHLTPLGRFIARWDRESLVPPLV